jgi:hypothetical protein
MKKLCYNNAGGIAYIVLAKKMLDLGLVTKEIPI